MLKSNIRFDKTKIYQPKQCYRLHIQPSIFSSVVFKSIEMFQFWNPI